MASTLLALRAVRLEKLKKLREMGIDPFPAKSKKEYSTRGIIENFESFEGKTVTLAGRLMSWREHGNITFGHLADESGQIQVFVQKQKLAETNTNEGTLGFKDLKLIDIGDYLEVTGEVGKSARGEISIVPKTLKILTKTLRPLPEKWEGLKDPEIIFRKRYLDLTMNPDRRDLFKRKAKFWEACRKFMKDNGFLEVETPILEHVTGGADAKPFITYHNALDENFYLRISTELYEKRLIGGGFEKIYTLGPNFRNEGIDDEHLQEYHQLEWYWAYADYRDNMEFTKNLYRFLAKEVYGKTKFQAKGMEFDLADEWQEIDYPGVIKEKLGVDIFADSEERMISVLKENGIVLEGGINKPRIVDNLWKIIRKGVAGPAFLLNTPKFISPLAKSKKENPELTERFQIIIAGTELGNGYSELNDPEDQYNRFIDQQNARESGDDEAQMMDIDFVEMLEYGMPPTSGFGMSERVFWTLEDLPAREATIFPQMKKKYDIAISEIYPDFKIPKEKPRK